jgi:CMP-N-acetylneuraminic acid synthetase
MKFAIVIPARKNSKSVRNKNRFKINGKPLIEYTLKQSHLSKIKLKFIISDDEKIKKISKKYKFNTEYVRPKHTSTDKSSTVDTLIHFVKSTMNKYDYDYLVVLQATSPLRSYQDINRSVEMIKKEKSLSELKLTFSTA